MIGPDGPRNAREMDEWLMQQQRERQEADAHYDACEKAYWAEQEAICFEQCDEHLDWLDKEIYVLASEGAE